MHTSPENLLQQWLVSTPAWRQHMLGVMGGDYEGVLQDCTLHFRPLGVIGNLRCCESLKAPYKIFDLGYSIMGQGRPVISLDEFEQLIQKGQVCKACLDDTELNRLLVNALSDD
ncbi:TPA: hypothetical protein ACNVX4_006040 [Pseudomonas aeruginosa]|nr:hypothetical protein [Pseudomonas aeruginosa]